MTRSEESCPCGSGRTFARCCGPLLAGSRRAASAEELMRSRYTANVVRDYAYLARTWHPDTRPERAAGPPVRWRDLEVLACREEQGGEEDRATVEFRARFLLGTKLRTHHEVSRFVRTRDGWRYLDGELLSSSAVQLARVGRNQPCPCGSGKKFKKCCLPLLS